MEPSLYDIHIEQPLLFEVSETATGTAELFPAVWSAAEGLTSPEVDLRRASLDRLLELGAPRLSPLVSYLLATRITDPDIGVRGKIVKALGGLFVADSNQQIAPEPVRRHLRAYLSQMRTRQIFSLLEVAAAYPDLESNIIHLLSSSPYAGNHLASILSERKNPLAVRRMAIHFIGKVGYLDAIPAMERLVTRLEARLTGQTTMPFAPPNEPDETSLLQPIQAALAALRLQ